MYVFQLSVLVHKSAPKRTPDTVSGLIVTPLKREAAFVEVRSVREDEVVVVLVELFVQVLGGDSQRDVVVSVFFAELANCLLGLLCILTVK